MGYEYNAHRITAYRLAISLGELRYGAPDERGVHDNLTQSMIHELGHALDLRVFRVSLKAEESIHGALSASKTAYDTLSLRAAAISESGFQRYLEGNKVAQRQIGGTKFLKALAQDGGVSITKYGDQTQKELFAECYSLYMTDSSRFRALRPAIAEYFDQAFGQ